MFKVRRSLLFSIAIIAAVSVASAARAQSAHALLEKAMELIEQNDLATAEQFIRMGLEKDRNHALGHFYLAEVLIKQNKSQAEALSHYRDASRLSPNSKEGLDALVKAVKLEQSIAVTQKRRDETEARISKVNARMSPLVQKYFYGYLRDGYVQLETCVWVSSFTATAGRVGALAGTAYIKRRMQSTVSTEQSYVQITFREPDGREEGNDISFQNFSSKNYQVHPSSWYQYSLEGKVEKTLSGQAAHDTSSLRLDPTVKENGEVHFGGFGKLSGPFADCSFQRIK
jgi:tetratricopeptide (TPR) repeat protein